MSDESANTKIKTICPNCCRFLKGATREMVGDIGICPKCGTEFTIQEFPSERRSIRWPSIGRFFRMRVILKRLKDDNPAVRKAAAVALKKHNLAKMGEPTAWALLKLFSSADENIQRHIVDAWLERGLPGRDLLLIAMKNRNPAMRQCAALLLGMRRDIGAVRSLCDALRDKSLRVREVAALALGMIGDKSAIGDLRLVWRAIDVQHLAVRRAARWALHKIDPGQAPSGEVDPVWLPWFHEIWVPETYRQLED